LRLGYAAVCENVKDKMRLDYTAVCENVEDSLNSAQSGLCNIIELTVALRSNLDYMRQRS
jgi:hypothetical protein